MQKPESILDPAQCWGAVAGGGGGGHYPRTGVSMGGVVPISDFLRLAVMQILIWWEVYLLIIT